MRASRFGAAVTVVAIWLMGVAVPHAHAKFIVGNDKQNFLFGTPNDDYIQSFKGHDYLFGKYGVDHIDGGEGRDWLFAGPGKDNLSGGDGNDVLIEEGAGGSDNSDYLQGSGGDDLIIAFDTKPDNIECANGNDSVLADPEDILATGPGPTCEKVLKATNGTVTSNLVVFKVTFGTPAGETLSGSTGSESEILLGGKGDDTVNSMGGGIVNLLLGGRGEDTINGGDTIDYVIDDDGAPSDALNGFGGNDNLFSADGAADDLSCGDGEDNAFADVEDVVNADCETIYRVSVTRT